MTWHVNTSSGIKGPRMLMYANGLPVNAGDVIIPQQWALGTNGGTPGDGVAISAYHCTNSGILGAEPGANWPAAAEDQFPVCGSVTLRSKNLYHVDYDSQVNGTGSQTSPVNVSASASATNGRVALLLEGTDTKVTAGFSASGNLGNNTYAWITSYNKGLKGNKPSVGTLAINNCAGVVVDGILATGTGTSNGLSYVQGAGTACSEVYFRNCIASGVRNAADGNNNGFMVTSVASTDLLITGLWFENCAAVGCGGYGFGLESASTAKNALFSIGHYNCVSIGCAKDKAAWGFGGYARFNAQSTGWTRVGGAGTFVYSRADATQTRRLADHGGSNFRQLTENTGTPTTPGVNEWGWSAGTLYLNLGVDTGASLTGHTIFWSQNFLDGAYYIKCRATGISSLNSVDGAGFGCDTLTSGWTFQGCVAIDCGGEGFVSNIALAPSFISCVALGNGTQTSEAGISINNALTATVQNCVSNGSRNAGLGGANPNGTITLKNSILANNGTYGAIKSGTLTETNNCIFGNASGTINGQSPDGTDVTGDPALDSFYRPTNTALQAAGVNLGGYDFYGKEFASIPSIGAVQYVVGAARSAVRRGGAYA